MTTTDPAIHSASDDSAMQRAIRQQLQLQWQDVLPPPAQDDAAALLCDDPVMQAYFERAAEVSG